MTTEILAPKDINSVFETIYEPDTHLPYTLQKCAELARFRDEKIENWTEQTSMIEKASVHVLSLLGFTALHYASLINVIVYSFFKAISLPLILSESTRPVHRTISNILKLQGTGLGTSMKAFWYTLIFKDSIIDTFNQNAAKDPDSLTFMHSFYSLSKS